MYQSIEELQTALSRFTYRNANTLHITDEQALRNTGIDDLIFTAVFASDSDLKTRARAAIRQIAENQGIYSASLHSYYLAIGSGEVLTSATVPAINLRAMTYDVARIIFKLKMEHAIGPLIFEIARSEIGYTGQRPDEYASVILAAAIKEGYRGPVFLQGDHVQLDASHYKKDALRELQAVKALIQEEFEAGFRNIDIDASTLVDLSKTQLEEQQKENNRVTAALTAYIRSLHIQETVSVGAEIGHIGGKNSTPEDLDAFMHSYIQAIGTQFPGISKISVQTGTSHGGVPLPDGGMAEVKLDFSVLERTGQVAREKYHIGGVVQHGASTLPNELFDQFPRHQTLEIHLATGFQNTLYASLPEELRTRMYQWAENNCRGSGKRDGTSSSSSIRHVKRPLDLLRSKCGTSLKKKSSLSGKHLSNNFALSLRS
ncbi:aldolase [Ktedonobacter sp. SOSP1-85]|uniref:class II fructose-bisphosphate aldolase n=1 Tax=Ktedonobacter sp. SOSP1-85 TaxID=2778367 RepID=UPI00191635B1|nr:class II fructose-bisphosphate aldolase [Ktedonobacter sp. SOSP1-85]GHO81361.1 aldolase [Ktedonobacter sp. SOSP1-85]